MKGKKEPPSLAGHSGVSRRSWSTGFASVDESKPQEPYPCKVEFYPDGVALHAPAIRRKPVGGARGEVSGWSTASRRRFRDFLLTHRITDQMNQYSCTYTIPGPPLQPADVKRLWHTYQIYLRRSGGCCVWRAEVQQRGAVHWHLIAGLPSTPGVGFPGVDRQKEIKALSSTDAIGEKRAREICRSDLWPGWLLLRSLWLDSLRSLGEVYYGDMVNFRKDHDRGLKINGWPDLSVWPGADVRAALVEPLPDVYGAWKRYLHDHVTKAKQEQIGENIGRHWGKVGKTMFERLFPDEVQEMTWKQYSTFLRWYQRMCTPYVRCPGALFGRRRGYTSRRGRQGKSIFFSSPSVCKRLVEWAVFLHPVKVG